MGTTEERFGTFRFNPFRMLCNLEGTSAFMGTMAVSWLRANAKVRLTAQHVQLQRYLGLPELLSAHVDSILFHFGCVRYSSPSCTGKSLHLLSICIFVRRYWLPFFLRFSQTCKFSFLFQI